MKILSSLLLVGLIPLIVGLGSKIALHKAYPTLDFGVMPVVIQAVVAALMGVLWLNLYRK